MNRDELIEKLRLDVVTLQLELQRKRIQISLALKRNMSLRKELASVKSQ